MADPPHVTPHPDPTVLTTDALRREIAALRELLEAKLESLEQWTRGRFEREELRFTLVEQQRQEQKVDTGEQVQAALVAQKEAVSKSEAATNKQLEQLNETFQTAIAATRRDIDDLKQRVSKAESAITGT